MICFALSFPAMAQKKYANAYDSSYMHKNNIKINISAWMLYNDVFMASYERTVSKSQSFSVGGGILKFPSFGIFDISNIQFKQNRKSEGYVLNGDYRFYLAKENKFAAPHGIYLSPYLSFYHFDNERTAVFTDSLGVQSNTAINSRIQVFNLGLQLGYQFVIAKRFTIDLVLLAPSITRYAADITLDANIDPSHAEQINTEVLDALRNHFPLLNKLIGDKEVHVTSNYHSYNGVWAPGFKYSMSVGYRFGR
jgi:hypothetical protein